MADDFNARIIEEFRANGGRVGGDLAGTPMVLIHHIGARSGTERVAPLVCHPQGDGSLVIVASNGGSPSHPAWYHNLRANPRIAVELGTETFTALAEELGGEARAEMWAKLLAGSPALREFESRAGRRIPVFVLTRQG
jgi:deazaflavin-dependent oxidoreductase (nitroreductase family)